MIPATFHHDDGHDRLSKSTDTRVINGPRPSPLKISKDSHVIHKPYSSSSNSNSSYSISASGLAQQQQRQQRQPVIIYAHSPKVIHTQPRDFMALVQKLTGLSRSSDNDKEDGRKTAAAKSQAATAKDAVNKDNTKPPVVAHEDNDSSSVLTDDQKHRCGGGGVNLSSVSPIAKPPTNPFLADIPLFTPTSNDHHLFCSPRPMYRFSESGNSLSPSFFEFIKRLPEC